MTGPHDMTGTPPGTGAIPEPGTAQRLGTYPGSGSRGSVRSGVDPGSAVADPLTPVSNAIGQAQGLPNEHYISSDTFALERESVLFGTWAGIGFGKDVPEPGDVRPIDCLGMPLLLVRDEDGEVGVFQNTCRHRGMILVEQPTNISAVIRCPYHSWCYRLDGSLRSTPHVGGVGQHAHADIDRSTLGLFRVRSHVWRDVVFVNVSGDAPEFATSAGALSARWEEFDQPLRHGGADSSFTLEVRSNWKLAVENFCESYHLPFIHPALNLYSRLEDHYHVEHPGVFSGQGSTVYRQIETTDGQRFPDFPGLSCLWDSAAEYIALYPNVLFGVHRDHAFAIVLEPVAVDRTIEHIELYYTPDCAGDSGFDALRTRNAEQWKQVFEEDIPVVEGMQRGRHGRWFDGGRFSPVMDGPTHLFHRWIAERVRSSR